jgi:hypothetical protein
VEARKHAMDAANNTCTAHFGTDDYNGGR